MYESERRCKPMHRIRIRYVVIFLCFLYLCNGIVIRDLIMATTDVWANIIDKNDNIEPGPCNFSKEFFKHFVISQPKKVLHHVTLDDIDQMNRLYYMGHITTQIIGGSIADKRGGRKILMIYGLITLLLVSIGPILIQYSVGHVSIIFAWRFMLGAVAGVLQPAINGMVAHWTPKDRRSTVIGFINATLGFGSILSRTVCKYIILATGYWQSAFYMCAIVSVCCLILWYFLGYSSFDIHPHISAQEKKFLKKNLGKSLLPFNEKKIPWKKICTSIPFWASFINHIGKGWIFFSMYFYATGFFARVLRVKLIDNLIYGQLMIFIVVTISMIGNGILCDYFVNRDIMNTTTTRKIFSNFGAIGVGTYMVTMSLVGCNQMLGYVIFMIMAAFYGMYEIGVSANDIDLSPNYAGTLKGITTTGEYLVVFAIPEILNKMTKDQTMQGWRNMYFVILLGVMLSNLIFTIAGRAKEEDWNQSKIETK